VLFEREPDAEPDQDAAAQSLQPPRRNASVARATSAASVEYQIRSSATITAAIVTAAGSTGCPSGTNCGNSAMKNTASFGLAMEVIRPERNADPARVDSAAAGSSPACSRARRPR
jgi:hypothetical protein